MQMLRLKVISAQGVLLDVQAEHVSLPAEDGSIGILKGHAPMIVSLKNGQIKYRTESGEERLEIDRGIAEIKDNCVAVICG
jgi:F-type H+-transporting ATPase subunit epsilon